MLYNRFFLVIYFTNSYVWFCLLVGRLAYVHYFIIEFMLLLLLSCFSCVRLCVTPETAAHQAPPSLGFSRQEHWSGLPFPSPRHESEKWKWSRSVMSYSLRPHGLQPTRLLHPWDFPGKSTGVECHCLLLLCIKQITYENLMYSTGNSAQCFVYISVFIFFSITTKTNKQNNWLT